MILQSEYTAAGIISGWTSYVHMEMKSLIQGLLRDIKNSTAT